jgi:polyhydroxyalkanoate synthesis regulator phasin
MTLFEQFYNALRGLTKISKEDLDRLFEELKSRGEVKDEDREDFLYAAAEKLGKAGERMGESFQKAVNPNTEKIESLSKKIDALVEEVERLKKPRP